MADIKPGFPIFQGIFATGVLSWLAWLSIAYIETDRTQDVVLERLRIMEAEQMKSMQQKTEMEAKTKDRWHRSEEFLYQDFQRIVDSSQDSRLDRLEMYHPPLWNMRKEKHDD